MLQFLMRHPEVVLSKSEILDNVWDPAFDGSENIVEVYVGYLRRKIDVAVRCDLAGDRARHGLPAHALLEGRRCEPSADVGLVASD